MNNTTKIIICLKKVTLICTGALLSAIVLNGLYLPNKLLSGGIAGIAMLLNLTLSWDVALVTFLINVPIFVIGYILMDKKYFVYSIVGMMALSVSLKLTENIPVISNNLLVVIALGGTVYGFAISLVALQHGSCGGNDIITRILHRYFSIPMGTSTIIMNICILGSSLWFFGVDISVMTLIANFVYSMALNYFSEKRYSAKMFIIKSKKANSIEKNLAEKNFEILNYEDNDTIIVFCLPRHAPLIRNKIFSIDEFAVVSIVTVDSVQGQKMLTDKLYNNVHRI